MATIKDIIVVFIVDTRSSIFSPDIRRAAPRRAEE